MKRSRCTTPNAVSTSKVILRDDRIIGSVLYGSVSDGPWYVQLMRDKVDVAPMRDQLVFGRVFAEQAEAALPAIDGAAVADADAVETAAGLQWQAA